MINYIHEEKDNYFLPIFRNLVFPLSDLISSNEQLIQRINQTLHNKKNSQVNIINDKLTLSVFSELRENMSRVKEINMIIRDSSYLPTQREVSREFEINHFTQDMIINSYDIIEKNKLNHLNNAKRMYDFIQKHVNVRRIKNRDVIKSNILMINQDYSIFGDSSLEFNRKRVTNQNPSFHFNIELTDPKQIEGFSRTFDQLWNNPTYTEDFKKQLLENLNFIYKEYSPQFLYYFTLYELFGQSLESELDRFESDKIGFQGTVIWNSLYKFQKDAVASAIRKIEKYNGCIIADSVGLGKTFEALAVIKYFELRQHKALVLLPLKLYENWDSYRNNYVDNRFHKDRFAFDILCHTDLTRKFGHSKSGLNLSQINWGNYDLLVIDESHNFRNRIENPEHNSRYSKLINDIIKQGVKTKVLMLSATPVNNSLTDLRNQLSLIHIDNDTIFADEGISSISYLLATAQREINEWTKSVDRKKNVLLDRLPADFFKLLEMVTISRSRKHITAFYGTDNIGKFPEKLKPITYHPEIDTEGKLLKFEATNEVLEQLKLAVYAPLNYVKPEFKEYYREKFQTKYGEKVIFYHEQRELAMANLHRFNLFKRLESSVYAFEETIRRLLEKIQKTITLLESGKEEKVEVNPEDEVVEEIEEDSTLDYKYDIKVSHLMRQPFMEDLLFDQDILKAVMNDIQIVLKENRDEKLTTLNRFIHKKLTTTPYNQGNKKLLIFSAFADTARYLYDKLAGPIQQNYQIYSAYISGSDQPKTTLPNTRKEFNTILNHFSPRSKTGGELPQSQQIDVMLATDCLSEGQNLQDVDCVINYDIQWNPVILIQRFGRIDRIGSKNDKIAMVNFFPNMDLNEYLKLEQRVKRKMMAANISSTGDEDLLTPEYNDFQFRKAQLEKLQNDVIELEDAKDSVSLTDLNMNDYLYELSTFARANPEIKRIPRGIYSVLGGEKKGCIFCFRHLLDAQKPKSDSSLYPYYLVYMANDGTIYFGNRNARETLKEFRKLSYNQSQIAKEMVELFNQKTDNASDMSFYSNLLNIAIRGIQGEEDLEAEKTVFDFGGYKNPFATTGADDFELISFLIVE